MRAGRGARPELPAGVPPGWRPPTQEQRRRQAELAQMSALMEGVYGSDGKLHRRTTNHRTLARGYRQCRVSVVK